MAAPLTKANVGTPASSSRRNTRWPVSAISRASAAEAIDGTPERSAPTAKMNGLPVTPIATGAGGVPGDLVQRGIQRRQPARAEGGRPGVVVPVVQGDQRELAGHSGQPQVADVRGGDDLVPEHGGHAAAPSQSGFSQITVPPMPS